MAAPVRIAALGGLGEIGMNCMVVECDGRIAVVDCGVMFPSEPIGVDLVAPDLSWLRERGDRVGPVFLTHGHEDHLGALPMLLARVRAPVYGPRLALALLRRRLEEAGVEADLREVRPLGLFKSLDARVVNVGEGEFDANFDPYTFDARKAAGDPELSEAIPAGADVAGLGRRSRFKTVYLVWGDAGLDRIILPIRGAGMWSMLYGYLALEADFKTIAGMMFYEQNETPGLGDQISQEYWQAQWKGKQLYDHSGELLFHVAEGPVEPGSAAADYQVDAITGATVTSSAVTRLVQYWFGADGYGPMLQRLREQPPQRPVAPAGEES